MTNTRNIITFGLLGIILAVSIVSVQQIYATGCPTQFVAEHIQNAKKALESNKLLCLPICKREKNKFINLHILETHERDKDLQLQTYEHPMGQRDNEILGEVWRKWATESGFKSFDWKKY